MTATYRHIDIGNGACRTCDQVHPLTDRHNKPSSVNKYGIRNKPWLLPNHDAHGQRCPGSLEHPKPWLDAAGLPGWDDMTDVDRGAALMFVWKVKWENNYAYARDNYPASYGDHPSLTALDRRTACRHAKHVVGTWDEAKVRLGADEVQRLYDLARTRKD